MKGAITGDLGLSNFSLKSLMQPQFAFDVSGLILGKVTSGELANDEGAEYTVYTSRILPITSGLAFLANTPFCYFDDDELVIGELQWINSCRVSALVNVQERYYKVDRSTARTVKALGPQPPRGGLAIHAGCGKGHAMVFLATGRCSSFW